MDKNEIEETIKLSCHDYVEGQINRFIGIYKTLVWVIVIVVGFSIWLVKIEIGNSKKEIKSNLNYETREYVLAEIQREFDKDNISKLVKDEAQKRVDLIADELIKSYIAKTVNTEISPLTKKLEKNAKVSKDLSELTANLILMVESDERKQEAIKFGDVYEFKQKARKLLDELESNDQIKYELW